MSGRGALESVALRYRRFACDEAAGRSPMYERLATDIAGDPSILAFLLALPPSKQQPNLLFGATRFLLGAAPDVDSLRDVVLTRPDELREVMTERLTQTNEPARCSQLLLALCRLPQPLALIEVGASAGLTLLVDYYSYDFDGLKLVGRDERAPTLKCHIEPSMPAALEIPEIAFRLGIDLNPLDPNDEMDMDWLECLIWPGEEERVDRLRDAIQVARRHPVLLRKGDLVQDLESAVSDAPQHATTVVFHSAVLAYVDAATRREFVELIKDLGVHWLSNEAPGVLEIEDQKGPTSGFVLVENGSKAIAATDPHGTWMTWLDH